MRVFWKVLIVAGIVLALSACGGANDESTEGATIPTGTTSTQESSSAGATDPASVQSCIEEGGYEVVASGDLPIIEGSKAVGVRIPSGANIMPGKLSAAIFWYASSAEAEAMHDNVAATFRAISRVDKIVAVYDPMPSGAVMTDIDDCITP